MASNSRIFFAGAATTFAVLAIGFGGGAMLAKSALQAPATRASMKAETPSGMRVILASSAEPAVKADTVVPAPEPQAPAQTPTLTAVPTPQKQAEKPEVRKADGDTARQHRKRYAERKARLIVIHTGAADAQRRLEPGVMAFGGDEPRNLFGN